MNDLNKSSTTFSDTKSHYQILDGLRGVASIMVICFHVLETFSEADHTKQIINHGYLAVDFFFLLSGYVIGYAYDDRWGKMSLTDFFKRRLIRLQPMIIMGSIVGAIFFYFGASPTLFPKISQTPLWQVILTMLVGATLIPLPKTMDIRGWDEMHPLNGPAWSLFFEYVANILYALFIRKFSNTMLSILVFLAGCFLIHLAVTSPKGDVIGGWSLDAAQLHVGFARLLYPFFAGLLLSRITKPRQINNAFMWSSLLIIAVLAFPRVGGSEWWLNGVYDAFSIIVLFPLAVYIGASGAIKNKVVSKISTFLGDISYPLYITHYPVIYVYTAWAINNKISLRDGLPYGVLVVIVSITIAYLSLKLYDIPVRKWLSEKFIK